MRGRARDLAVEKDGKPEIIPHNQTTWAERLSASRTAGPSKGSTDHQPSSQQAPPQAAHETKRDDRTSATKSATSEPAQEAGQTKAGWADREKANRTEGKRSGQESFVEKLAQERESGKATTPKARTTPARGQDKSHDHER